MQITKYLVRFPYCVEGDEFKLINLVGERYVCGNCGTSTLQTSTGKEPAKVALRRAPLDL